MILKFRTMFGAELSWTFVEGIEHITYRRIEKEIRQNEKFCPDYYVSALDRNNKIDESMQDYLYVTCSLKNDKTINVCSNMVIYLLNDEGKTIERIN